VGVVLANEYYQAGMAGFSIPAAEHSTITSWGREQEVDAFRNMLKQFAKPGAIVAVVSDSYNIYDAAEKLWGETLRQEVIDSGATVVVRPDSGEPVLVVNTLLHILDRKFGSKMNSKGYKVLNNVRIIQGDGVNPYTIECILKSAKIAGFSADNLAFGMGGGLLQQVNRDTQKFAYKCSAIQRQVAAIRGGDICIDAPEWRDVYKDPIDDAGKRSKAGRLGLGRNSATTDGKFTYFLTTDDSPDNILTTVFENGTMFNSSTFDEVRGRAGRE
jgi:nicotinamide phosphoribosyltransferase